MLGLHKNHFAGPRAASPSGFSKGTNMAAEPYESPATPTATMSDMHTSITSYGNDMAIDGQSMTTMERDDSYDDDAHEIRMQTMVVKTERTIQRRLIAEIDGVDEAYFGDVSIESFIEYISTERLVSMPHEGSHWDKTLKAAEFFALQVSAYGDKIERFFPGSQDAANMTIAACLLLLKLGPNSAQALESSFAVFYKLGLSLSFLMRNEKLFQIDRHIKMELGNIYSDLIRLVAEVTLYYLARIETATGPVSFDFNSVFGHTIHTFYRRKSHIADAMWNGALHGQDAEYNIRVIREWLSPRDQVIQILISDRLATKGIRTEHTCEWAQRHLLDFLRSQDQTLAITASSGNGKTTLSGWIAERLQRPLGRRSYETISFSFETDIPSECTSLALVKSLLVQLLELNVGHVDLYKRLVEAYEMTLQSRDAVKLEVLLWKALRSGLDSFSSAKTKLVIIVDGLDEVSGGEAAASSLFAHVHKLATTYPHVRAITLSTPMGLPDSQGIRRLPITLDHTHDDLRRVILDALPPYPEKDQAQFETWVDELVHASQGSFLRIKLVVEGLSTGDAYKGLPKVIKETPKTQLELIQKFIASLDLNKSNTKSIITWMLAAERPLTVRELTQLLRIDLHKHSLSVVSSDIVHIIKEQMASSVVIQNGIVRFRHDCIRQGLIELSTNAKQLLSIKDAQKDLALRILLYSKLCYNDSHEPSFEFAEQSFVDSVFQKHSLLEYATRYWIFHLRKSSLYAEKGSFKFSAEIKALFPTSPMGPLIEWFCWETQTSVFESLDLHTVSLSIRRQVIGDNHKATLQCLLILGNVHKRLSHTIEMRDYIYQASVVAQVVMSKFNSITLKCSSLFLEWTESVTSVTRTEVITQKETIIKYMVSACKHQHGATSEVVLRYLKMLAQLYVDIQEEHLARITYEEIHEIVIRIHGKYSEEARAAQGLIIVLNKENKPHEILSFTESVFKIHEEIIEITDIQEIIITITTAANYESRGDLSFAEEIYISLWCKVIEICHAETSIEWQVAKIDVVLAYVRFLHRHHRHAEASAILICVWEEFEHCSFESETIVIRIKAVGELMRSVGLLTVAVTVFKSVWSYFKRECKTTHKEAISTTTMISETVEELITKSTETSTTSTSTTMTKTTTFNSTETETTIREIFESSISEVHSVETHTRTIKASSSLIALYVHEERWSEAIAIIQQTLEIVWKVLISGVGMVALPDTCISECILIAIRLAQCYHHQSLFEKAEQIYIRVYQACVFSLQIKDERVSSAVYALIAFYEEHHCHDKSIEVYIDIVNAYRRQLGANNALTIKTLYALAGLLIKYGRKLGYEYYLEIVTSLNKGSHVCHHGALEAAVILVNWYFEEERWTDVKQFCEVICATFVHEHSCKFDAEIIQLVYKKYVTVLKLHVQTEFMVLRKIALEYRDTCIKVFGTSASVTIEASIQLASVYEQHEKYQHEALSIYEEVVKRITNTTSSTTSTVQSTATTTKTTEVKQRLSKLYVKVINSSTSTSTSVSSTTIERAISLTVERYEETKIRYGCWHESTLTALSEIILLYRRSETKEAHGRITVMLQAHIVEILTTKSSSNRLYHAAIQLTGIFVANELTEFGFDLIRTIRGQILMQKHAERGSIQIRLDHERSKECYIFLVAFEYGLRGSVSVSYAEIMAEILTESMLVERYTRLIESKASVEIIILHGARLRQFLVTQKRQHQLKIIEEQLYEVFTKTWSSGITKTEFTFMFFTSILEEIGRTKTTITIEHAAAIASVERVKKLLEHGQFHEAYEVASCAYHFLGSQKVYHNVLHIPYGFKLSQYMAGRLVSRNSDAKLQAKMLELSKNLIRDVFEACQEANLDIVQLNNSDLNDLVGLLGDQQNFTYLEWLLTKLWSSREVQKGWQHEHVIGVGLALVQVRFSHGNQSKKADAIRLCEDICYNLRRARGAHYPPTLQMYKVLASLYTAAERYRDAMSVHEDILRRELEGDDDGDDDSETRQDHDEAMKTVNEHLDLLKRSHQRLGGWDRSERIYIGLYAEAKKRFSKQITVPAIEQWPSNAKDLDQTDVYAPPAPWTINRIPIIPGKILDPRRQLKRATSNWGLNGFMCELPAATEIKRVQPKVCELLPDAIGA